MKKMYVVFENLEEVHLGKDVGMLPFTIKKNGLASVTIFSTLKRFTNNEFEKDVKLKFFDSSKNRAVNKLKMIYGILHTIRKVDYLMVFHGGKDKLLLFILCKILNPKLITYVKLDMGELGAHESVYKSKSESKLKIFFRMLFNKYTDVFTVETKKVYEIIKDLPAFKSKLYYLPNGFYAQKPYDFSVKKEKIIVTVGRIGTPPKNNELLLSAIESLQNLGEYKFYFIGPVESSFQARLDVLLARRDDLRDKIILTGNITDKKALYEYYKKAEIFCFTSIYESFGLVLVEAMYFGCYLMSTDLAGAYDLTNNEKNGTVININDEIIDELFQKYFAQSEIKGMQEFIDFSFEDVVRSQWFNKSSDRLALELKKIINNEIDISNASKAVSNTVYNEFNWISIANNLIDIFEDKKRKK